MDERTPALQTDKINKFYKFNIISGINGSVTEYESEERRREITDIFNKLFDKKLKNFAAKLSSIFESALWRLDFLDNNIIDDIKNKIKFGELVDYYIIIYGYMEKSTYCTNQYYLNPDDENDEDNKANKDVNEEDENDENGDENAARKSVFGFESGLIVKEVKEEHLVVKLTGFDPKLRKFANKRLEFIFMQFCIDYIMELYCKGEDLNSGLNKFLPSEGKQAENLLMRFIQFYMNSISVCYAFGVNPFLIKDIIGINTDESEKDIKSETADNDTKIELLKAMAAESSKALSDCNTEIKRLKEIINKKDKDRNSAILDEQRKTLSWQKKYEAVQKDLNKIKEEAAAEKAIREEYEQFLEKKDDEWTGLTPVKADENGVYSYKNILMAGDEFISRLQPLKKAFPNLRVEDKPVAVCNTNTDLCIIMSKHIAHPHSWGFITRCQNAGIPYAYTPSTNPEQIAADVARQNIEL